MNSFKITEITDGKPFSKPVYLDDSFLLLNEGVPFSNKIKQALIEWGFKEVLSEGDQHKLITNFTTKSPLNIKNFEAVNIDDVLKEKSDSETENSTNKVALQANKEIIDLIKRTIEEIEKLEESDIDNRMILVQKVYDGFKNYILRIFTRFVTHRELKIGLLSESVQYLCEFIKNYKKYILRIQPKVDDKSDKNFIISHSIRATIYAIVIGQNLKMQSTKLVELGVATILHEIGQIRLPPQLYLTDRKLLPAEKTLLSTHTILGFNILKENNFPLSIQYGVLEHHERENGLGYPRKLVGEKISLYGKIISVVCSFEAISAPRHYKEAKSTHEAMIEMLRNADKQYDDIVMKALVQSVSLFPIGGYVFLANGKVAQVTDTNGNDPRTPIVQILGEKNKFGFPLTIQTDNDKFKIVRVLNKNEITDILKALNKK